MNNETTTTHNSNTNETASNKLDASIQALIDRIRNSYAVKLQPESQQPIELHVDGLCENPGAMHIGLFARQGDSCLFAEHMFVGHGTCNEAEYIAVQAGLSVLQTLYPEPKNQVQVFSDSQLVTKQVNGEWRAKGRMLIHCLHLLRLRKTYPFTLSKIPRAQNEIADGLAQKYVSKNSGRCLTLENGRFMASTQNKAAVRRGDTFNALISEEFRDYLAANPLRFDLQQIVTAANDGAQAEAIALAKKLKGNAQSVFAAAPQSNGIVSQWLANAAAIVDRSIALLIAAIERGDLVDLHYLSDELAGANTPESDLFASQVEGLPTILNSEDKEIEAGKSKGI